MQHTHTDKLRILTCDKKHITQVYIYRVYTISLHYDLTKVKKNPVPSTKSTQYSMTPGHLDLLGVDYRQEMIA